MSIVFFGTPLFSVPSLAELLNAKEDIRLVITQTDKAAGRGHKIIAPPVKEFALKRGLNLLQPSNIRTEDFINIIRDIQPEFIVVVAYGRILPVDILTIPEKGCINVHASLLPKYRGAAPIQWAIINGEKITGVTTMLMDEGLDTGDILMQREIKIRDDDNSLTLSERLAQEGAQLLIETISGIRKGIIVPFPQEGEPTYAPVIKKEDGRINWQLSAIEIHNRVRGLFPWPTAFTYLRGKLLKILKTEVVVGSAEPGSIARKDGKELLIGTGHDLLSIKELQIEGKKPIRIEEFLNGMGRTLMVGEKLDDGTFNESHSS